MNLYEINEQIEELTEQMIDPETGEINEEVEKQIKELDMDRESKIEYLALKVKNLRAEEQALKAERDSFKKRAETTGNRADSIERYIGNILQGEPFSTTKAKITWRKSESVDIVNEGIIPDKYMVYETKGRPDKSLIKDAINSGEEVPGAMVVQKNNMKVK